MGQVGDRSWGPGLETWVGDLGWGPGLGTRVGDLGWGPGLGPGLRTGGLRGTKGDGSRCLHSPITEMYASGVYREEDISYIFVTSLWVQKKIAFEENCAFDLIFLPAVSSSFARTRPRDLSAGQEAEYTATRRWRS